MVAIRTWSETANRALGLAVRSTRGGAVGPETLLAALLERVELPDGLRLAFGAALPVLDSGSVDRREEGTFAPEVAALIEGSTFGHPRHRRFADGVPVSIGAEALALAILEGGSRGEAACRSYLEDRGLSEGHFRAAMGALARGAEIRLCRLLVGAWKWSSSQGGIARRLARKAPGGARYLELRADGSATVSGLRSEEAAWAIRVHHVDHVGCHAPMLEGAGLPIGGLVEVVPDWSMEVKAPVFDAMVHRYRPDDGRFREV